MLGHDFDECLTRNLSSLRLFLETLEDELHLILAHWKEASEMTIEGILPGHHQEFR